ncbi:DUF2782 domain-containing protein [Marinobacter fonticola]|uniref:DUF2782 domain-containing protein n=1 Tax=Marinobacter fonticola TaxID=2603215 RepID=UPI0011E6EE6F|nr:DUF2782 domain-containing protein [Marinobacter fonticola]
MKRTLSLLTAVAAGIFSVAFLQVSQAQESAADNEPVRASEYQPPSDEPQVVIRPGEDATYYEYRVNGELREIRVDPKVGPVYYLIPVDGGFIRQDGSQLVVPKWVLFEW